jgi:hypothetical protein
MPDASLMWGGDLSLGPNGDLSMADGTVVGQQRVMRRLMTNPLAYIWQPGYGGGLGQFVGQVASARVIEGAIRGQLYAETAVAHQPEPAINTSSLPNNSIFANILYSDAATQTAQTLTFSLGV